MRAYVALAMLTALPLSITPAVAQEAGAQPDWIEQARIVAQMQGITVGEAVRRARLQEKVNRTVERFQNDPDYGGAWIEQDARGFRANFAFRGGRKPSLGDTELQEVSSFSNATRSMSDLAQARASLARTLRQHGIKGAISVVQRTQRMELYPDQPDRLRELISQGTITIPDFVDVKDGPLVFRPEYDVYGAGSMNVEGPNGPAGNCNGGFVVTNGSVRGISTAGHCEDPGYDVVTHRDQPIGQFMGAVIYENGLDVAWHRNSTYNYLPRVRINATSYYTVTSVGPQIPAANTTVCIINGTRRRSAPTSSTTIIGWAMMAPIPTAQSYKRIGISRWAATAVALGCTVASPTVFIRVTIRTRGSSATSIHLRRPCRGWA